MKIASSALSLYSEHTAISSTQQQESLTVWKGQQQPKVKHGDGQGRLRFEAGREMAAHHRDKVSLHQRGKVQRRQVEPAEVAVTEEQKMQKDLNMQLLRRLFEKLTGRKFQVIDPLQFNGAQQTPVATEGEAFDQDENAVPVAGSEGYGLAYDYHMSHYESETTEFRAGGVITTSDGQEIDFSLSLSMSREFYTEQNVHLRAGDALKDPLAVNFSGTAAQLTSREFAFDIDADGHQDQLSFVAPGSGFLALDTNEDGRINDGSELFGALSGDGFDDLSRYDSDNNMWIDENDSIYDKLRIWTKDSNGRDQLLALGQVGVGAIYLGHVESLFSIKDEENSLLGQVQSTGLALMESGQAVTVQQLDLVA